MAGPGRARRHPLTVVGPPFASKVAWRPESGAPGGASKPCDRGACPGARTPLQPKAANCAAPEVQMLAVRRAAERGHANHGWLDTRHTFSFADYHDPAHMGFRSLRVINEDRVAAGRRLRHAPAPRHGDHHLRARRRARAQGQHGQRRGHPAGRRAAHERRHRRHAQRVQPVATTSSCTCCRSGSCPSAGASSPATSRRRSRPPRSRAACAWSRRPTGRRLGDIHQDARVYAALLAPGDRAVHALAKGRGAWLQVARGTVSLNGTELSEGDGVAIEDERELKIEGVEAAEILLFDLA